MESPARAPTGSGSKPPSRTVSVTVAASPSRRRVARLPAGTVPGGSDTYATLSPAPLVGADAIPARTATPPAGAGSETMRPWGGGGHVEHRLMGPSEQPPSHASAVRRARASPACTSLGRPVFTAGPSL